MTNQDDESDTLIRKSIQKLEINQYPAQQALKQ